MFEHCRYYKLGGLKDAGVDQSGVIAQVIERLFRVEEDGDPKIFAKMESRKGRQEPADSLRIYNEAVAEAYIPLSRAGGRPLYILVRGQQSRNIAEFGTSFGISTIIWRKPSAKTAPDE